MAKTARRPTRAANGDDALPLTQRPLGAVLEFMRSLWGVNHALESRSRRMKVRYGVTGPERMVVRLVGRFPGISAGEPVNTLIWECDFPNLEAAQRALDLFSGDGAHEELFRDQAPFINNVRIEFYRRLLFSPAGSKSS